jgi:hypothetical protein
MVWQNINSSWNKEDREQRWRETLVSPIYKEGDTADYSSYQLHTEPFPAILSQCQIHK